MEQILNDLIAEQARVDAMLSTLDEKDWERCGPPGFWQVSIKDMVIHIAFFDYAAKMLATGAAPDMASLTDKITMDEETRILEYRDWSPAQVMSWWRRSRTELCNALYYKDPKDRVPWAVGLPMSARSIASARLMELWAHSTDICAALGKEPIIPGDRTIDSTLFLSWQARPNAYRINGYEMPDTPMYLELVLPSGNIWAKGDPESENYIKGSAAQWALVAIRRLNWRDSGLEVKGSEAERYASIVQTYAGVAEAAPESENK